MLDTLRPSPADADLQAARMEARIVLTQPSALYFMQDWDRALTRACEMTCRAGVTEATVLEVCARLRSTADATGRGADWVVREARHEFHAMVCR